MFGTLAHRHLQLIADSADGAADRLQLDSTQAAMVWWLEQRGAAGAPALAQRLVAVLARVTDSERGRWLLARRAASAAELALAAAGRISVIDRTFVEDGVRWIVDYKITPTAGLDASAVAVLAESHRAQLETYGGLLASAAEPVQMAVFFIDGLQWVELPRGSGAGR